MLITIARSIAFCILVLSSASPADARKLKIATWNIEHLAEANNSGCEPRQDADYLKIRQIVDEELKADIIAFQEIESATAAQRVFDPATYNIEISRRTPRQENRKPECRGRPGYRLNDQLVGFAIRKDLIYRRLEDYVDLAVGGRRGVVIEVTDDDSGEVVTMMSVHLKSACPRRNYETSQSSHCRKLKRQVPLLELWIDERSEEDSRFIVLGDYNRFINRRDDVMWRELDDGDPEGLKLVRLDSGRSWPCKYDRLDHIVADASTASHFDPRSVSVLDIVRSGNRNEAVSDHCPVVATLDLSRPIGFATLDTPLGGADTARIASHTAAATTDEPLRHPCGKALRPDKALTRDLRWVRESAEYCVLVMSVFNAAGRRLDEIAAARSDNDRAWVVSIDADETVLDNSRFAVETQKLGTDFSIERWRKWVKRRAAPAVPGALAFLSRVLAHGGKIAIITNRDADQAEDTRANLLALGLPADRSKVCILGRPKDAIKTRDMREGNDKDIRRKQVRTGAASACWQDTTDAAVRSSWTQPHDIVMHLGDNVQDLPGVRQELARRNPGLIAARIGRDFFILPNPNYGSWD